MQQSLHSLRCEQLKERTFWAQGIAQTLQQYGKSLQDLPVDLRHHCVATNQSVAMISQTDMNRLWSVAAALTGDDCFGLQMAQSYSSNILKVLGLAAVSSETVGDAVQRVLRYLPVLSTQVQAYSAENEHALTLYFEPRGTPHPLHIEAVVACCARIWRSVERKSQTPLVLETRLSCAHPGTRSRCESLLPGRVRDKASRIGVRLNRAMLHTPLVTSDPFLLTRLDASLEDMLCDLPTIDFAEHVKRQIGLLIAQREVSEELVAAPFNMSARHLRRKLSEAQTSYEKLLDEVRMEMAMRLIQAGRLNLGHVALQLGFLNASSFTRAFRRWTGISPSDYKKKALSGSFLGADLSSLALLAS